MQAEYKGYVIVKRVSGYHVDGRAFRSLEAATGYVDSLVGEVVKPRRAFV